MITSFLVAFFWIDFDVVQKIHWFDAKDPSTRVKVGERQACKMHDMLVMH
jgi:hypothetical protein